VSKNWCCKKLDCRGLILGHSDGTKLISDPKNAGFCRWFQGVTCEISNTHEGTKGMMSWGHTMPCHAPKRRRICRTRDRRAVTPSISDGKIGEISVNHWKLRGPVASFCWTTFPMCFWDPFNMYLCVCLVGGGRAEQIIWRDRLHGSIDVRKSCLELSIQLSMHQTGMHVLDRTRCCNQRGNTLHYLTLCYTMLHYVTPVHIHFRSFYRGIQGFWLASSRNRQILCQVLSELFWHMPKIQAFFKAPSRHSQFLWL